MRTASYREPVRSVRTALSVFETVAELQPVGLSAIARRLDVPKTTVQRSLATLAEAGWLVPQLGESGRWTVSARFAVLTTASPTALTTREIARPHLAALREQTGETVSLFTIEGAHMVMLDGVESRHAIRVVEQEVGPLPIHVSAAGRAMIATQPPEQRRASVEQLGKAKLLRYTERSVVDTKELLRRINIAARVGYAVVDREYLDDLSAVGAAVLSAGTPVAGVALLGPSYRLTPTVLTEMGRTVADCAMRIGAELTKPEGTTPQPR
jgi:IclR family acetate operon transcriptional repressor